MRSPSYFAAAALVASALVGGSVAQAQAVDPGVAQVSALDDALLSSMKQGDALSAKARYKKLEPTVERVFDFPTMTRYAIGPSWSQFSPADQHMLIDAFSRLSIASFAHNFNGYSGEKFEVDPVPANRGVDKIVKTQLVTPKGDPVILNYRMRLNGGTWRVIDVLLQGTISQLTIRQSDLASVVAAGDAKAIAANLNAQADKLLAK